MFCTASGEVRLTAREVELLQYLAARPGHSATREQLLVDVWGYAPTVKSRTVDLTVHRLRRKVEIEPSTPRVLTALYGQGYHLVLKPVAPDFKTSAGFFGRVDELEALALWWQSDDRTLTLLGPGGAGKTTLLREFLGSLSQPIQFVDLTACTDATEVAVTLAASLGLPTTDARKRLVHALRSRDGLVLALDNLEQLQPDALALIATCIDAMPQSRWLFTSRIDFDMGRTLELGGLDGPDAAALFIDRAKRAYPSFSTTPSDMSEIEAVAAKLEGVPLALELAASRMRLLSPAALLERLENPLDLLSDEQSSHRHGGLAQVMAHSWMLLTEPEQHALMQLSWFRGPITPTAAEALLGPEALSRVDALLRASLLRVTDLGGHRVYGFWAAVREFSRQQADAHSDADALRQRWVSAQVDLAKRIADQADELEYSAVVLQQAPDLARAAEWAPAWHGEGIAHLARALILLARNRDISGSIETLITRAIRGCEKQGLAALEGELRLERVRAQRARGTRENAAADLGRAIEVGKLYGLPRLTGRALQSLGNLQLDEGHVDDAVDSFEAAHKVMLRGYRRGLGRLGCDRAMMERRRGDLEQARQRLVTAVAHEQQYGTPRQRIVALGNLASVLRSMKRYDEALTTSAAAIDDARQLNERVTLAGMLTNRGALLVQMNRCDEAIALYDESATLNRNLGSPRGEAYALGAKGSTLYDLGDTVGAEVAMIESMELHQITQDPRATGVAWLQLGNLRHLTAGAEAALPAYHKALELLSVANAPPLLQYLQGYRAIALGQSGQLELAAKALAEAPATGQTTQAAKWLLGWADPKTKAATEAELIAHFGVGTLAEVRVRLDAGAEGEPGKLLSGFLAKRGLQPA